MLILSQTLEVKPLYFAVIIGRTFVLGRSKVVCVCVLYRTRCKQNSPASLYDTFVMNCKPVQVTFERIRILINLLLASEVLSILQYNCIPCFYIIRTRCYTHIVVRDIPLVTSVALNILYPANVEAWRYEHWSNTHARYTNNFDKIKRQRLFSLLNYEYSKIS